MHELAITESIADIVIAACRSYGALSVKSVSIDAGMTRNLIEEWVQTYYDYHTEGTPAHGAVIRVNRIPVEFRCNRCRETFGLPEGSMDKLYCPRCSGDDFDMVHGRELSIRDIELEFAD